MAGRNNILINWLNISFDTFNLLHRWFGRIVALEALIHSLTWAMGNAASKPGGWSWVASHIFASPKILTGALGTFAFLAIMVQASSVSRHAFYETFKYLHIGLAILSVVGLWYHLKLAEAPQIKLMYLIVGFWVADRAMRLITLVYRNGTGSRALVEALPGDAVRVTVNMPRPWTFQAGQHAYLYMPSVGLMTSHPFSVAWSDEDDQVDGEKLAMTRQDVLASRKTSMSFVIRQRTGFTKKLFQKAENSPDQKFWTSVFAEGPYGGKHMVRLLRSPSHGPS